MSGDPYNGIVLPGSAWPEVAKGRVDAAADPSFDRLFHGLPDGFAPTHKRVFEPRLGVAWSLDEKTVLRGGVGMFHNRTLLNDSFDPKAFAQPAAGTFGYVGRNILTGPNQRNWDLSAVKRFRIREDRYFQIRADLFNFTNHPNWSKPVGDPNNVNFGRVTAKSGYRQVQITSTIRF